MKRDVKNSRVSFSVNLPIYLYQNAGAGGVMVLIFSKGHSAIKNAGGVIVLVLCTSSQGLVAIFLLVIIFHIIYDYTITRVPSVKKKVWISMDSMLI